jgi:hypothetical protein
VKIPMANEPCCESEQDASASCCSGTGVVDLNSLMAGQESQEVCCGGPPPPKANPYERAGYTLEHYVQGFLDTGSEAIPLVASELSRKDHFGTIMARLGLTRDDYKVAPGLYGVGEPGKDSPVIVTANYKLTFDFVRKELTDSNAWLLVLDTCGVNVWCAAGKATFSTDEIVERIEKTGLANKVEHRQLIVPQLGATGVSAHGVKKKSGFKVVYGPVRAADLKAFIATNTCKSEMRRVTFTLKERFELVPVEFYLFGKKIWWLFPLVFILSGIGPSIFSMSMAWERGLLASMVIIFGGLSGAVAVPLLLPWIPGKAFSWKGLITGVFFTLLVLAISGRDGGLIEILSVVCLLCAISSYLAMNFTGSTPYTSPTGVEKEMKIAIPIQLLFVIVGGVLWLTAPFVI